MHIINIPKMQETIRHIVIKRRPNRKDKKLMIWGPPGCGKSEGVTQVFAEFDATEANNRFVDVRLSQWDQPDLRGLAWHREYKPAKGEPVYLTKWNMPEVLPFKGNPLFDENAPVIGLFLDELTSAPAPVQAIAYQLINDGRIGEHVLMDNVRIVAASNRDGDRGVTNRMGPPLANRFFHVEVTYDIDAFYFYGLKTGMMPEGLAFLKWQPQLLETFMVQDPNDPQRKVPTTEKNFATPRTWEHAFDIAADTTIPMEIRRIGTDGYVGEGNSAMFWGFIDTLNSVIPNEQIEKDPNGAPLPHDTDLGMHYATAVSVSGYMKPRNAKAMHTYLTRMSPEYTALAWQLATQRDDELYGTPEYLDFAKKYKALFNPHG